MKSMEITAVGIDVSKRKSTVAIRRPGGVLLHVHLTYLILAMILRNWSPY